MLNQEIKAQALLAYHHTKSDRLEFTVHPVIEAANKGNFTLGAGRAFSEEDKENFIDIMLNLDSEVEFIDLRILVKSRQMLVWYNPPRKSEISFKSSAFSGNIDTIIPGLIFIATPGNLRCYSYKGKSRPTPDTKLYWAPLGNMYKNGSFCTGNCETPKDNSIASIPEWERFVLECTNTHTGNVQVLKSASNLEQMIGFYQALSCADARSFPARELIPMPCKSSHQTLGDALRNGGNEA